MRLFIILQYLFQDCGRFIYSVKGTQEPQRSFGQRKSRHSKSAYHKNRSLYEKNKKFENDIYDWRTDGRGEDNSVSDHEGEIR